MTLVVPFGKESRYAQSFLTISISFTITPEYPTTSKMMRTALFRSARCLAQASASIRQPMLQSISRSPMAMHKTPSPSTSIFAIRSYASSSGLGQEEVTGRILDLLKNFDKVCSPVMRLPISSAYHRSQVQDPSKVHPSSSSHRISYSHIDSSLLHLTSPMISAWTVWILWR